MCKILCLLLFVLPICAQKPTAGTLVVSNALTSGLRLAYLLNGSDVSNLVNSVGGAEPLLVTGSGMTYDSGTESRVFAGSGFLQIPTAALAEFAGISAITVIIGYKSSSAFIPLWSMGGGGLFSGDYWPFNDGNIYTATLVSVRYSFADPGGITWSNFNQLAVTGAGGGNVLAYINGALINTHAAGATVTLGASGMIGQNSDGNALTGNIQFLYAWKRVLSSTELATLAADQYTPIFTSSAHPGSFPFVM